MTLIEIMIVIVIIAILSLGTTWAYSSYMERARDTNRKIAIKNLDLPLRVYLDENAELPSNNNTTCSENIQGLPSNIKNGIWCKGEFDENIKNKMGSLVKNNIKDPKNGENYEYYTDSKKLFYIIKANLEVIQKNPKENTTTYTDNNGKERSFYYATNFDEGSYGSIYSSINNNSDGGGGDESVGGNVGDNNQEGKQKTQLPEGSICYIENGEGQIKNQECKVITCNNGYDSDENQTKCEIGNSCKDPIYRDKNGVTIKARECAEGGREYEFEGENWYVAVDNTSNVFYKIKSGYQANRIVTTKLTIMSGLFSSNNGLQEFNQDISNWDTSNVTDMSYMFNGATSFNQNISNWDVSNVTNMKYMFLHAKNFNQPIGNWDISNATNIAGMFSYSNFNQDISNWDVSNIEDMWRLFMENPTFNQPIGNWNISKAKNLYGVFYGANSFNQDISNWNVSNVEGMEKLFYRATNFNQPIGNWDVSNVKNMNTMFYSTYEFNQDISNWDTSNVEDMSYMFGNTKKFNQDISRWNTSKVKNMERMFIWSEKFNQPIGNWDVSNVENMRYMFNSSKSFNQDISNWNTSKVKNMERMFEKSEEFNQDISKWRFDNIQSGNSLKEMFQGAKKFNQDTSKICVPIELDIPIYVLYFGAQIPQFNCTRNN